MSFKMNEKNGKFGLLFRYTDRFVNYTVEFDFKNNLISFLRRDPFQGDKQIMSKSYTLNSFFWYRTIVQ